MRIVVLLLTLKHNSNLGLKMPELSKLKTNITSTKQIINTAESSNKLKPLLALVFIAIYKF